MPPMGKGKQGVIRKPKNTKKTAKRLFSYFKEYKFMLFIVVLAVISFQRSQRFGHISSETGNQRLYSSVYWKSEPRLIRFHTSDSIHAGYLCYRSAFLMGL